MEEAIRTRLRLLYESVLSGINSAKNALQQVIDGGMNYMELELIETKLRSVNNRFVSEIQNYCQVIKEPNIEVISNYTLTQIQAEELTAEINVSIKQNRHKMSVVSENINIASKLPRMELGKFDGDILKWYQFWDQFSSNVDNRNINDVDKLMYLQSVLEGDAKQAIEGLDTTNKNYRIAVNTLKERYGKPSAIIDAHYVALYRIKAASKSVKECRQVLNDIERHLRVLSSLGEDVNHNHLRVMIIEKFPEDLIYELRLKLSDEYEPIDMIRRHLEYIISARETSKRLKRESDSPSKHLMINDSKQNNKNEHFTLDSLHVRSDNIKDKRRKFSFNLFNKNEKAKLDNRYHNKFNLNRKRSFEILDKDDEPPKRKFMRKCIFCKENHFNDECTIYKTVHERKRQLGNRCYNCLGEGHKSVSCRSKRKCRHCNKFGNHNRALCPVNKSLTVRPAEIIETNNLHIQSKITTTLLQTCLINVSNLHSQSKTVECRCLLDCGSQRSYITEKVATFLNLPVLEKICLSIFTFGAKTPHEMNSPTVCFSMTTRIGFSCRIYANVVPHISNCIKPPVYSELGSILDKIKSKELTLADDGSCGDRIDLLIGNDYYHSFMYHEKLPIGRNLFLVNSDFGWIWSGVISDDNNKDQLTALTYYQNGGYDNKLNEPDLPLKTDDVKRLWDLESIGITDSPKCNRDDDAIKQFNRTIRYINNRYYIQWPWTEYPPNLPSNLGLAHGRLINLLKRLNQSTIKSYHEIIKEQLKNGIIEIVPDVSYNIKNPIHYLPHHCVFSRDKSHKIRIVYDASAKTSGNRSLNDCLYRGPLMLEDLTGLIIKFREHSIGIIADVEKAFLQLGLQEPDKDVTRFVWLKDINVPLNKDNILHLRFCRVPFGIISSPFLLNATIKYHLMKSNNSVLKQIAEDIYVDNVVTGAKTVSEAHELYISSKKSFDSLSMNLREWNSNSKEFVSLIPKEYRALSNSKKEFTKVLGLLWDVENDDLYLKYDFNEIDFSAAFTKRDILKIVASIYDPCGYAIPIILPAKVFFQKLWKQKIKWDTKLNEILLVEWKQIALKLYYLKNIRISRHYLKGRDSNIIDHVKYQLHCFTDASMEAYAACVYLRSSFDTNNIVNFIIGKSRLVPIKDQNNLQIPKLELLGVLIGYRLLRYVMKFLRLKISDQFLWTDSQIVLSWYRTDKLLSPFVSRRINEIRENKSLIVKYIPGRLNPADIGTRSNHTEFYDRWLKGPDFLLKNFEYWLNVYDNDSKLVQIETQAASAGEGLSNENNNDNGLETNRIMAVGNKEYNNDDNEINTILTLQSQYFPKEVHNSLTDLSRSLGLYKDSNGLLRCKGRFKHTDWTHSQKEPILLPKNSDFTYKIILDIHQKNHHVGVSHTLAILRKKFWVPHGRSVVQNVIKKCQQCIKYGGGPYKLPSMPDLPPERVRYSSPFTFTGLDYFGPVYVKEANLEKRWVCFFTCLAVRAIHMEIVKDLSAEGCLLAIRRFVAVRGLPQLIISDNATQFKLTAETLTSDYCIENNIRWRFIPELAPWFGGFYERIIGLVKHCLRRTLDKHTINHDQLLTIIKEIEAVLNTRPLTTVGSELEYVLTPSDFLCIGGPTVPEISSKDFLESATVTKSNLIDGWKRGQIMVQEFVKMFNNQYLTCLRERNDKHSQPRVIVNRIPKVDDTVQIKTDGNRANWKVGKIKELIRGSDGQIRVAKVKTLSGEIINRSIGHLYPLEVDDDNKEIERESGNQRQNENSNINLPNSSSKRQTRQSATKCREKIKEWTSQIMLSILDS